VAELARDPSRERASVSDSELFERQDALQAQARAIFADLDALALLREVGEATQVGSSALGLMVAHDIDITTLCPSLDPGPVFDFGRRLARHPRVRRLTFRQDTGRWNTHAVYPDGIYWLVEYVADPDDAWTLDLWFLREGTSQFDIEHVKRLPGRLTVETRVAILRIKEAVYADTSRPRGPSYAIYEAVLDHGIRTPEEYERYRDSPTNQV
jgi:hypothetical protein